VGLAAACSSGTSQPAVIAAVPDASTADALALDAGATEFSDAPVVTDGHDETAHATLVRFAGHVDYMGPVANAKVSLLSTTATTTTDSNGDFFFYVPLGSVAVVKVEAPNTFPMIRGVVVRQPMRIRVFYLAGPPEQSALQGLGLQLDPSKGVVEVDFRNSTIGGYGVQVKTSGGALVTPGFGMALDSNGNPQQSTLTLAGGDGSTLLLGNVNPGDVSFTPVVPAGATLPCKPCDAPALPIEAGAVTWFDFECGTATDCE
jgi:hypothetical protein